MISIIMSVIIIIIIIMMIMIIIIIIIKLLLELLGRFLINQGRPRSFTGGGGGVWPPCAPRP